MYPPPFDQPAVTKRYGAWEERGANDIRGKSIHVQIHLNHPKMLNLPPPVYDPQDSFGDERHRAGPQSVESVRPSTYYWSQGTTEQAPTVAGGDGKPAYHRIFWWTLWVIFLMTAAATFAIGPGVATIMTGNAISKAADMPHFSSTRDVFFIGVKGSLLLCPAFLFLGAILLPICKVLDARFRDYYTRLGKLGLDSKRPDGHFPVFLLWIPLVFFDCFLAGLCANPRWSSLTIHQLAHITAIGASLWTPGMLVVGFCLWWIGERIDRCERRMWDPAVDSVGGDAIPFLYRQWEALTWLFLLRSHSTALKTVTAW